MSEEDNSTSQHNGGPAEGRIRKGQIDWVPGITKAVEYRLWSFKFKAGANTYLSKEVYSKAEERRWAWINALIIAATKGGFDEMVHLLELHDSNGVRCEEVLQKLEEKFLPAQDTERKKASSAFMGYQRRGKSLVQSVKELRVLVLECKKLGYSPDDQTLITKYESLLMPQEMPLYRLYIKNDDSTAGDISKTIKALEDLGKDAEGARPEEMMDFEEGFNGGAFQKRKPMRKGFIPKKDTPNEIKKTNLCGSCGKHCPASRGEGKEKCYAYGKECDKCHKKGHFKSVCRTKSTLQKTKKAITAVADESF